LGPVVAITASQYHTCALQANGEVVCWGTNINNQLDLPPDLNAAVQTIGQLAIQQ
jgi:alpha-tubulin suppressor-like RCC1 family protein